MTHHRKIIKRTTISGDEEDYVYGRRYYRFKAGVGRRIKRQMNKRMRRRAKLNIK